MKQKRKKKTDSPVLTALMYVFLILWATSTIYPIIWVVQNSFKAKDKILTD